LPGRSRNRVARESLLACFAELGFAWAPSDGPEKRFAIGSDRARRQRAWRRAGDLGRIAPFVPHAFYGVSFPTGPGAHEVNRVYPKELPRGVHIALRDGVLESPDGDLLRGFRLHVPEVGDAIHVSTASGTIVLHASAWLPLPLPVPIRTKTGGCSSFSPTSCRY
jgi:hypothetical protein